MKRNDQDLQTNPVGAADEECEQARWTRQLREAFERMTEPAGPGADGRPSLVGDVTVNDDYRVVAFSFRSDLLDSLTRRELHIMALVGTGLGNKGIAARLGIGEGTAKTHVSSIHRKLGVSTRASLARIAMVALASGELQSRPRPRRKRRYHPH